MQAQDAEHGQADITRGARATLAIESVRYDLGTRPKNDYHCTFMA